MVFLLCYMFDVSLLKILVFYCGFLYIIKIFHNILIPKFGVTSLWSLWEG